MCSIMIPYCPQAVCVGGMVPAGEWWTEQHLWDCPCGVVRLQGHRYCHTCAPPPLLLPSSSCRGIRPQGHRYCHT